MPEVLPVDEISTGDRIRTDLGDLTELAESIGRVGLLHPIVVDPAGALIAGARRLAAVRRLGWTHVPVTRVDAISSAVDLLMAERDENTARRDFTVSEALRLRRRLEDLERPKAAAREKAGKAPSANLAEGAKGETRELASKPTGYGRTTLDKAQKVHDVANDPTAPADARQVAQAEIGRMDTEGKVDRSYQNVERALTAADAGATPETVATRDAYLTAIRNADTLHDLDPVDVINATIELTDPASLDDAIATLIATSKRHIAWHQDFIDTAITIGTELVGNLTTTPTSTAPWNDGPT